MISLFFAMKKYIKFLILRLYLKLSPSYAGFVDMGESLPSLENIEESGENIWRDLARGILIELRRNPSGFLREPTISKTVHPNQQDLAKLYFDELNKNGYLRSSILPRIHESVVGDPYLCGFFPFASTLTMQHLYYMHMITSIFGISLHKSPIKNIIEIGGGHGNFYRLMKILGYDGAYTIIDLPIMRMLQVYYLSNTLPDFKESDIKYFTVGQMSGDRSRSEEKLFIIATFSVSEMSLSNRADLEPLYDRADYLFFSYNKGFDGVDNFVYFKELKKKLETNFSVLLTKDPHREAWFLLAQRK